MRGAENFYLIRTEQVMLRTEWAESKAYSLRKKPWVDAKKVPFNAD
jgi:hypothetical protein